MIRKFNSNKIFFLFGLIIFLTPFLYFTKTAFADSFFINSVNFGVSSDPNSVATGDFNGDTYLDLVVTNNGNSTVSVLINNGDRTFKTKVDYATGGTPSAVAVGLFNNDLYLDLAVSNTDTNTISIFIGNGNGTFQSRIDYPTGGFPQSLITGDFNSDSKLDLATTGGTYMSVLLGNGNGTFQTNVNYSTTWVYPTSLAAGDFNNDTYLDIVTANHSGTTVSYFRGIGNGTFAAKVDVSIGTGAWPDAIAVGDFNGDSNLDFVTANMGWGNASVVLGNGNGTFQSKVNYAAGNWAGSVAVGLFNNDSYLDLAITKADVKFPDYGADSVAILLGNGNGTFQTNIDYKIGNDAVFVSTGDFDNDSYLDLVVVNELGNSVSILFNSQGYTAPSEVTNLLAATISDTQISLSWTAPVDNGGAPIVGYKIEVESPLGGGFSTLVENTNSNSTTYSNISLSPSTVYNYRVSANNGAYIGAVSNTSNARTNNLVLNSALFYPKVDYTTEEYPDTLVSGDFNGDTYLDLAVSDETDKISIFLGNGDGTFQTRVNYLVENFAWSFTVGDVNNDSYLDLISANVNDSTGSVLLGNGDGTFQTKVNFITGSSPNDIVAGNFNNDLYLDLVISNGDGDTVSVLLGNGDGTFQGKVDYETGGYPDAVTTGLVNNDLYLDLISANWGSNTVSILFGNGDGTFQDKIDVKTGNYPTSVLLNNLNNDLYLDLIVASASTNTISVLLGNGDGTFQDKLDYGTGIDPSSVVVGFLNDDLFLDMAVTSENSPAVSVLLGNGDGTFQTKIDYGTNEGSYSVILDDFNNDSLLDLVVTNYTYSNPSFSIFLHVIKTTLTTEAASAVSTTTATLNGNITDLGGGEVSSRGFEYGENISYGNTTTENGTFSIGAYTADITSLSCETTYHYRSYANNSAGISYGDDQVLTTNACPVTIVEDGVATITTQEDFESGNLDAGLNSTENPGNLFLDTLPARTNFVSKWGVAGSNDGEFNDPLGIAVDSTGNVYVVDTYNNRIQKFSSEGVFISKWGTFGYAEGEFNYPSDISIDTLGNVYVVDKNNNRIQKFSNDGVFISTFGWGVLDGLNEFQKCTSSCLVGINGNGDGQLSGPIGIGVDLLNNIYVADNINYRIQKFDSDGNFILKWGEQSLNYGFDLVDNLSIPNPWAWEAMTPLSVTNMAAGSGVIDGKIYVAGGTSTDWTDLSSLSVYDPASNTWDETKAPMSQTRVTPVSVVVDGKLYIVGGRDYDWAALNTIEIYDPANNTWDTTKAPMLESRIGAVGAVYNGKIYIVGGAKESCANNSQVSMEVYDIATDTWETKSSAPVNKLTGATGQFINGILYISGGQFWCDTNFSNELISYNPSTDTWNTELAVMPGKRAGGASAVVDGKFYYIGGTVETGWNSQNDIFVYDPLTNTWETFAGALPQPIHRPMVQLVGNDFYIIGGKDYIGNPVSTNYKINKTNFGVLSDLPKIITDITWTEGLLPPDSTLELFYSLDDGATWVSLGTTPGTYPIVGEVSNYIHYKAAFNTTTPTNYVAALASLVLTYSYSDSFSQYADDDIGGFRPYPLSPGGEFTNIFGIDVDKDGNVYVADEASNYSSYIHKFTSTGEFITNWGGPDSQYMRGFTPYDVAVDTNGDIHFTDYDFGVVYKSNNVGDLIYHYGDDDSDGAARDGEFSSATGLAIDSSDNIYIIDSGNNRIQKFKSLPPSVQPIATFTSSILKASSNVHWSDLTSSETLPDGTSVSFQTRTGSVPTPDSSWSEWLPTTGVIASPDNQYFQVKAILESVSENTPTLHSITINFEELNNSNLVLTLTTESASSVSKKAAQLSGNITDVGDSNPTVRGFEYGLTTSYGKTTVENGSFGVGVYTANIASLSCDTTYHYRSYATNSTGTSYGTEMSFHTDNCSSSGGSTSGSSSINKQEKNKDFDVCPNIIGEQYLIPSGLVIDGAQNCVLPQQCNIVNGALKQPLDVVIVIDKSGSMSGTKITQAKNAANAFIDNLVPGSDRVAYVNYSTNATLVNGLTTSLSTVKSSISSTIPDSNTNIGGAIKSAYKEIKNHARSDVKHVIILLTDGQANVSDVKGQTANDYAINQANISKADETIIYTVGLGSDVDSNLLKTIANQSSNYYYSPTGVNLSSIYLKIAAIECTAAPSKISDTIVYDTNLNGKYDSGEVGAQNVTVTLTSVDNNNPVRTTTTSVDGTFSFDYVTPGDYSLCISLPSGTTQTFPLHSDCYNVTVVQGINVAGVGFTVGGGQNPIVNPVVENPIIPDDIIDPILPPVDSENNPVLNPPVTPVAQVEPIPLPETITPPTVTDNSLLLPNIEIQDTNSSDTSVISKIINKAGSFFGSILGTSGGRNGVDEMPNTIFDLKSSINVFLYNAGYISDQIINKTIQVFENPVGKIITSTIETTGAITGLYFSVVNVAFANPVSFAEIFLTPMRLWTLLLIALGIKKRNVPWGTVYDSSTKQPLDPAYVVLQDLNGKEIATSITDLDGRYGFLVPPGQYRIFANKTNYEFPSKKLAGKNSDELYQELYFNEIIDVKEDGVITKNIPMDSVKFDWNEFAKKDKKLMRFFSKRELILSRLINILFALGFVTTFIAMLITPVLYNILIFVLYLFMIILQRTILKPRAFGYVKEKLTENPLSFAIMRVFFVGNDNEIIHKITDKSGKYYCLIPNGTYYTKIENKNQDESYSLVHTSGPIEVKNGYINEKFEV